MKFLRRWGWQIALNLLLISALFIGAAFLKTRALVWWPNLPVPEDNLKAVLWMSAMVLSLPMLIAVVRKWQAFGMLVSEMSVTRAAAGESTSGLRWLVSSVVFVAGCLGLLLLMLLLGSAVLPSWNLLLLLVGVLLLMVLLLRSSFIKLHSKAQIALRETLESRPAPPSLEDRTESAHLPSLLHKAKLLSVTVCDTSPAIGKLISELKLRTETGASIVGIERSDDEIVNPPVDEEILAGDRILLIGTKEQVENAKQIFQAKAAMEMGDHGLEAKSGAVKAS